jgi:hypothetical protein
VLNEVLEVDVRSLWLGLLASGCAADKVATGLPCGTVDLGYASPEEFAVEALDRSNCYRDWMGLEAGILDPLLDDASQSHAEYMAGNEAMTHQQDSGLPGFTGEWVWDRVETAGFDYVPGLGISEVVAHGYGPAAAVDAWVASVYHRIPFTSPYWNSVGFGLSGDFTAMTFITPFPHGARTAVIYPTDGQVDVVPTFDSDWEVPDPAPDRGVVGMPITVTVADDVMEGDGQNPYNLQLVAGTLIGSDGMEVEVRLSDPSEDSHLYQMALMLPLEPLESRTEYEAVMTIEWNGQSETLNTTFVTSD